MLHATCCMLVGQSMFAKPCLHGVMVIKRDAKGRGPATKQVGLLLLGALHLQGLLGSALHSAWRDQQELHGASVFQWFGREMFAEPCTVAACS